MKNKLLIIVGVFFIYLTPATADVTDANEALLPEALSIYTNGTTVINHPEPGFTEAILPTVNLFKGTPGCYIACYSHQKNNAVYNTEDNFYVLGQVRVAGKYKARVCEPTNFSGKDISANDAFKAICSEKISGCLGSHCWAGGDTGGWFGIP